MNRPTDSVYLGTGFGVKARTVYWSPSKKKYYVASMFPAIQKGYDVFERLPTKVIPTGFYVRPVEPEVAKEMMLEAKKMKIGEVI